VRLVDHDHGPALRLERWMLDDRMELRIDDPEETSSAAITIAARTPI
jgi:hypothetical protein